MEFFPCCLHLDLDFVFSEFLVFGTHVPCLRDASDIQEIFFLEDDIRNIAMLASSIDACSRVSFRNFTLFDVGIGLET